MSDDPPPLSAADRHHCLEALDRLIAARNQVLELLIERVNSGNNGGNMVLDSAVGEVKRAAHKLGRYHPDGEHLPQKWSAIKELGILAAPGKKADMSEKAVNEWKNGVIRAMKDHTAKIVSELEQERATLRAGTAASPSSEVTDPADLSILEAMFRAVKALSQREVEAATRDLYRNDRKRWRYVSERLIRERWPLLLKSGFIAPPPGRKRKASITARGRQALQTYHGRP
jgi:hypothetical protein